MRVGDGQEDVAAPGPENELARLHERLCHVSCICQDKEGVRQVSDNSTEAGIVAFAHL